MPRKSPEQLAKENDQIAHSSLQMMEELLEINRKQLTVLEDIAAMIEETIDNEEEEETE